MKPEDRDHYCLDLTTTPRPEIGMILVTGASGYIGGRLVPELLDRGYRVRVLVRAPSPEYAERWPGAEVVVGDLLNLATLQAALRGVAVAYYLVHSLLRGSRSFEAADILAAANFRTASQAMQVRRIIYLGGLGDERRHLSPHLQSRLQVAHELTLGSVPVTILRAAIIIGSGSASYEIIYHLIRNVAVIPLPHWARTRCQPIAVRDVIKYLVGVLETDTTAGRVFDIGGHDILTYEQMLRILAGLLGKQRLFLPWPLANIRLFAYLASLVTPVPHAITRGLLEGSRNEVICQNTALREILPFATLSCREALLRATFREEQDRVHTRWSDAYPPAHELALQLHKLPAPPRYTANYTLLTEKKADALFHAVCAIGGRTGWFHGNWMWRLRGRLDRLLLGVGTVRGRRSHSHLRVNDVIDFWRVESLQLNQSLLLRAEMRLPGQAWLQFTITPDGQQNRFSVTAYYQTDTLLGRAYWYFFLPFHDFLFNNLIKKIEKQAQPPPPSDQALATPPPLLAE